MSLYDEIMALEPNKNECSFWDCREICAELAKKYDDERQDLMDALQLMLKRFETRQDNLFSQRSACSKASNLLERLNK